MKCILHQSNTNLARPGSPSPTGAPGHALKVEIFPIATLAVQYDD